MRYNDVIECIIIHHKSINTYDVYREYGIPYYHRFTGSMGIFKHDSRYGHVSDVYPNTRFMTNGSFPIYDENNNYIRSTT